MKKIFLLTKTTFHLSNIGLVFAYLYPGSIFGLLLYGDKQKQPQLSPDFLIFSSNHFYFFTLLTCLGVLSFYKSRIKFLFLYLFFISVFLELCHILIPQRSFEYQDLAGNFLGVFIIFMIFYLYHHLKKNR